MWLLSKFSSLETLRHPTRPPTIQNLKKTLSGAIHNIEVLWWDPNFVGLLFLFAPTLYYPGSRGPKTERDRDWDRETETERQRQKETDRDRETETETERDRETAKIKTWSKEKTRASGLDHWESHFHVINLTSVPTYRQGIVVISDVHSHAWMWL